MKLNLPMIAKLDRDDLAKLHETKDFQVALSIYAREQGWRVQYFRKTAVEGKGGNWVGIGPKGWPDLFMVRGEKAIVAELKSEIGTATAEQKEWLAALGEVPGIDTYLWRPRDAAEAIERLASSGASQLETSE